MCKSSQGVSVTEEIPHDLSHSCHHCCECVTHSSGWRNSVPTMRKAPLGAGPCRTPEQEGPGHMAQSCSLGPRCCLWAPQGHRAWTRLGVGNGLLPQVWGSARQVLPPAPAVPDCRRAQGSCNLGGETQSSSACRNLPPKGPSSLPDQHLLNEFRVFKQHGEPLPSESLCCGLHPPKIPGVKLGNSK